MLKRAVEAEQIQCCGGCCNGEYWEHKKFSAWVRAGHMPTDGAVFSVPALFTLALPIFTGAVLHAERVAHTLVARRTRPPLLAAARATHAYAVCPAVDWANLCGEKNRAVKSIFTYHTLSISYNEMKHLYYWDAIKHAHWPTEQSGPIQLGSQLQTPVSGIKAPWPWHWSGHCALGSSQLGPPQPGLQWHSPFTQMPLFEQVGSKQSTVYKRWKSWVWLHLSEI